jgi:sialic acid synthase SpsE
MIDFNSLNKTYIIAEIGSNHNQSLSLAKEMIDSAKESGADAVKFQSIDVNELYFNPSQKTRELHSKIDLEESWHKELKEYSDKKEITFFSAPTYLKAIDILEDIGVELYKLASAQVGTFPQIVEAVAKIGKPTLLSTGIVSYGELEKTVRLFAKHKNDNFAIFHCNSLYPTPYEKANLQLIEVYKSMFGKTVGYSDHTEGIYASLSAVTLGAKIIERHFTTDKNLPIPDAPISILPHEFSEMVKGIRAIEQAIQKKSRIEIEKDELGFKRSILYRLVTKVTKKVGESFKIEDFEFKRDPNGINVKDSEFVIEKMVANRDISKGELLSWEMLKGKI